MRGHVEIVKFLLQKSADRGIRNKQDKVPIDLCQPCWSDSYRYTRQVQLSLKLTVTYHGAMELYSC